MMPGIVDFNRYTKQEAFDTAVEGIRGQNYQCSMNGSTCAYRGADGKKCAVGFLIPDEYYVLGMDRAGSIYGLLDAGLAAARDEMRLLLANLQDVHDNIAGLEGFDHDWFVHKFESGFAKVAKDFDLVYTPPKEG